MDQQRRPRAGVPGGGGHRARIGDVAAQSSYLGVVALGEPVQRGLVETVAAQQRDRPRPALDAVPRILQADGSAAAGDHHVVQCIGVKRPFGRRIAALREGTDVAPRRFGAPQRHLARLAEQRVDDGARRPRVDLSARQVEMPEGLVGEFEPDAAMHRGQRRLRRGGVGVARIDALSARGEQPDGPAARADQAA